MNIFTKVKVPCFIFMNLIPLIFNMAFAGGNMGEIPLPQEYISEQELNKEQCGQQPIEVAVFSLSAPINDWRNNWNLVFDRRNTDFKSVFRETLQVGQFSGVLDPFLNTKEIQSALSNMGETRLMKQVLVHPTKECIFNIYIPHIPFKSSKEGGDNNFYNMSFLLNARESSENKLILNFLLQSKNEQIKHLTKKEDIVLEDSFNSMGIFNIINNQVQLIRGQTLVIGGMKLDGDVFRHIIITVDH